MKRIRFPIHGPSLETRHHASCPIALWPVPSAMSGTMDLSLIHARRLSSTVCLQIWSENQVPILPGFVTAMTGFQNSIFTHDPSLVTDKGAVLLRMGKSMRLDETDLHEETYREMNVPVLGRIEAPGTVEGGDCVWVDSKTLAVGRGVRTNQSGIDQLRAILEPLGIAVLGFDLPLWQGEEACLHLMSIISPLAEDLALVHLPLLPAAFYQLLKERGIRLVVAPEEEFAASNGLNLNVLPTAPYEVIAVAGFEKTKAAMEAAGCTVTTFDADALCIACEGGPTCLTRPVWRQ